MYVICAQNWSNCGVCAICHLSFQSMLLSNFVMPKRRAISGDMKLCTDPMSKKISASWSRTLPQTRHNSPDESDVEIWNQADGCTWFLGIVLILGKTSLVVLRTKFG